MWLSIYVYVPIKEIGSGALPGLMLDIGLLKITLVFFPISSPFGGSNPADPYPIHFTLRVKANIYLI